MRYYFILLLLATGVSAATGHAAVIDTGFNSLFERLPVMAEHTTDVKKTSVSCKAYEGFIKDQLLALYTQSNHQSRLLAMLAGKSEDAERYDFSKITIARDPALTTALETANTTFFAALNDYQRTTNNQLEEASKITNGTEQSKQVLEMYSKEIPLLTGKVRAAQLLLEVIIKRKGYHKVLVEQNNRHPYYIQLLEIRGLLLDRVTVLNKQVEAAGEMAAIIAANP